VVEYSNEKPFTKGGYSLTIINPTFLDEIRNPKKKSFPYWIIILIVALASIGVYFFLG
jgi:hypothetical protein